MKDLRSKGINGFIWSFIENFLTQGIHFITIIVLARLLSPEFFGLYGISILLANIALVWLDTGFSYALIRKEQVDEIDYSSVFWANSFFGIIIYALFYFLAPLSADYFNDVRLPELVRISALMILFSAFSSVHLVHLMRDIDFKTQAKITFWSTSIGGIVSIAMALTGYGLVSLVWRFAVIFFVRMILLWWYTAWVPQLVFSGTTLKSMASFVYQIAMIYSLGAFLRSAYGFVVGKNYSMETMGHYTTAESYSFIASTFLTATIQKVSLPLLSKFQNNIEMQKDAYRRILIVTMFITFVSMLLLIAVAEPVIVLMIGEKWLPAVPYFQLLCLFFMASPFQVLNQTLFSVNNKPGWFFRTEVIRISLSVGVIVIGAIYGIYALLIGMVVVAGWAGAVINAVYAGEMIGYPVWDQVKDVLSSFITALTVAGGASLISYFFVLPAHFLLLSQLFSAGLFLLILCAGFRIQPYKEILGLLHKES